MAAHFLPLGAGQRPSLAQHGIRHGNLADIVQVGGHVKERRLILAQIQGGGQHQYHVGYPVGVLGGVGIAGVHGGDDALDQIVILH